MIYRTFPSTLFLAFLFLSCAVPASGQDIIDVQDSVGIGQPFLVRVQIPLKADDIEVVWNKKSLHPSIEYEDNTSSAIILLGVRLNAKPAREYIRVNVVADGRMTSFTKEINIISHEYAKERLSVAPKMVTPPESEKARIQREREAALNAIDTVSAKRWWSAPFSLPVKGKMLSGFGLYRVFNKELKSRHKGQDFRAYLGTPIRSIAPGKIVLVGKNFYYSGNCVYIDHGNGVVSSYSHLSKIFVKHGDQVRRGQKIGLSGATGRVTGAHLHLSAYAQGVNVDPVPLFSLKADAPNRIGRTAP